MFDPTPGNIDPCESIQAFVETAIDAFGLTGPLYQFGSCPGGNSSPWTGLRGGLVPGVCVDFGWGENGRIERLPFADGAARTVLCIDGLGEAFELRRVVDELVRILSPGGALLICSTAVDPRRGQPPGRWRLAPRGLEQMLSGMAVRLVGWQGDQGLPHTLYAVGFKPPLSAAVLEGTSKFLERFPARLEQSARRAGWRKRLAQWLPVWRQGCLPRRRREQHKIEFAVHFSVDGRLDKDLSSGCLPSEQTGTRLDLTQ